MNLLIAAATSLEIRPLLEYLQPYRVDEEDSSYKKVGDDIKICITGIGCVAAAYALSKYLSSHTVDIAVQAGIAGSFLRNIPLGHLMRVNSDVVADMGAENEGGLLDLFDMGFLRPDESPYHHKRLMAPMITWPLLKDLPAVNAITVNRVSGRPGTISERMEKYHTELESMEGAAFHYVCLMEKLKFIQIRSISNYVEIRDRSQWNIPLAVKRLNELLIQWIEDYLPSLRQ